MAAAEPVFHGLFAATSSTCLVGCVLQCCVAGAMSKHCSKTSAGDSKQCSVYDIIAKGKHEG